MYCILIKRTCPLYKSGRKLFLGCLQEGTGEHLAVEHFADKDVECLDDTAVCGEVVLLAGWLNRLLQVCDRLTEAFHVEVIEMGRFDAKHPARLLAELVDCGAVRGAEHLHEGEPRERIVPFSLHALPEHGLRDGVVDVPKVRAELVFHRLHHVGESVYRGIDAPREPPVVALHLLQGQVVQVLNALAEEPGACERVLRFHEQELYLVVHVERRVEYEEGFVEPAVVEHQVAFFPVFEAVVEPGVVEVEVRADHGRPPFVSFLLILFVSMLVGS